MLFRSLNFSNRNFGLDLLRAVAIMLVLVQHAGLNPYPIELGRFGVELFFVLSGFLIGNILLRDFEKFEDVQLENEHMAISRRELGFSQEDVVVVYSGSLADWQFKKGLEIGLANWLAKASHHKLFFLSKRHHIIDDLSKRFPNQLKQKFVSPEEVAKYLLAADYGLLVREDFITNQVASPVKFAEYLACGLQVIISRKIGDYSEFVEVHDCGLLLEDSTMPFPFLGKIEIDEKFRIRDLAKKYFSKQTDLIPKKIDSFLD